MRPGRLDLAGGRWVPFVQTLTFKGINLTGATFALQVRLTPDTPGPPLVIIPPWLSHLELVWDIPALRSFNEALARDFTVILYDRYGSLEHAEEAFSANAAKFFGMIANTMIERFIVRAEALYGDPV